MKIGNSMKYSIERRPYANANDYNIPYYDDEKVYLIINNGLYRMLRMNIFDRIVITLRVLFYENRK